MSRASLAGPVQLSVRRADQGLEEDLEWASVSLDLLRNAQPWRTFRWHRGQKHYSGTYWSATVGDHVIYESRLELGRLLFADFDPEVRHIVAQPFLIKAEVQGKLRRHIPDYLLLTDGGPVVVDVKPRHRLERPQIAFTFAWTKQAVESRGWQYEVWSEPDPCELENVRVLAGYRRSWLFAPVLLDGLRSTELDGRTLGDAFRLLPERPRPLVKSAVLHLLWSGHVSTDLDRPLCAGAVLKRAA
ncbi:TnsA-like heteromeric transposase endonuclease subunit [Streptomyces sp. NBC_01003]|uniref:TnsA-like heteromeric transposase endonuclease subunit n=1 Tax=Streptomyces sp. NBC_01003 TaxID=2903714 RepID=UPI00386D255C|nr:TnsA-like heteromeric transposase endonuclease subunit [Streptomyces sp. NBC_01003]